MSTAPLLNTAKVPPINIAVNKFSFTPREPNALPLGCAPQLASNNYLGQKMATAAAEGDSF